jgi:hypothetical protein
MHSPRLLRHTNTTKPYETPHDTPTTSDQLIIDTGGGWSPNITERAWYIVGEHEGLSGLIPYGSKDPPESRPTVDAVTHATIMGRDEPVLLKLHRATLIGDPKQSESLVVPFDMMRNGIAVDCTPLQHGGSASITYDGEEFPWAYDGEKMFIDISKPTQDDINAGEAAAITTLILNNLLDAMYNVSGSQRRIPPGATSFPKVPIEEWHKRFAMLPTDVVTKTLTNTTQFYVNVEHENRRHPRRHLKSAYPALRCKRRDEVMATDTFFPSITSTRGNTCSQFFVGQITDQWFVHPLKKESQNFQALQDQIRYHGAPQAIRSEHDWVQKWCCDVHNAAASRKLNWLSPNTVADGHTYDISKSDCCQATDIMLTTQGRHLSRQTRKTATRQIQGSRQKTLTLKLNIIQMLTTLTLKVNIVKTSTTNIIQKIMLTTITLKVNIVKTQNINNDPKLTFSKH